MNDTDARWSRKLAALSAVTAIAVSVIYLPQPLLTELVHRLGTTASGAGAIATAVQLGYAVGIFLLVPLNDRVQPRRQITIQLLVLTAALLVTAALPTAGSVAVGFVAVGLVANVAQLIIPTAARLAPADRKHATTSTLVGALLIGIFGGRIAAAALGSVLGWRGVLVVFALLVLLTVPAVRRALPAHVPLNSGASYPRLLLATIGRVRNRPLLASAGMQLFGFAAFNSVWTVMVFHLTSAPFHWTVPEAGLFGLVGLGAGVLTPLGGRWVQRFGARRSTGAVLLLLAVAMAGIVLRSDVIGLFAPAVFVMTWANQVLQSTNQSRALMANPEATAQANTVFMTAVFLGGSLGGILGPVQFQRGGMAAVAVQGLVLIAASAVIWGLSVLPARTARSVGASA